ncbi:hypothetical protein ACGFY7_34385 [Streptomyces prunicolor]|uniref:hypothetical protein n=1 Tax=Streptomyces prunicolor TaxID=67348 RepID=UPI0037186421
MTALSLVDAGVRASASGGAGKRIGYGWDVAGRADATGVAGGCGRGVRAGGAGVVQRSPGGP